MNTSSVTVSSEVLASKGKRFLNYIIDYVVQLSLVALFGIAVALMAELSGNYTLYDIVVESENSALDYLIGFIILLIYYIIIETFTARSIGKYITQTMIVLEDGSKPSFTDILKRSFSRIIPFEQFSFLGEDARGWHDSISNTYVVDLKKYNEKKIAEDQIEEIAQIGTITP
ncbi:RDD family protein [Sediminibacter sp. Hel_I_10]|uniref:RDD family protein n=1 Tax=Sediminibacter sp. Hel_I_10 TaxID=1392490 RepID=UPI000691249F|nr:RDD family protein [Sediminibacter sp. Hel_I_10]